MSAVWTSSINKPVGNFGAATNLNGGTTVCEPQAATVKPPWLQASAAVLPFPHVTLPSAINLFPPFIITGNGTKLPPRLTPVSIRPGAIIKPPAAPAIANHGGALPPRPASTDNGGHGGISLLNGNSGNAPTGSRTNNSAMDNAASAASSSGFNNISGNAGGAGIQARPRLPVTASTPPKGNSDGGRPVTAGTPPKGTSDGGHGGIGTVNGNTGNAPTTRPQNGIKPASAAAARPAALPRQAPDSGPVDFGGCPSCSSRGTFQAPK